MLWPNLYLYAFLEMINFRYPILWSFAIHCNFLQSYGNLAYSCNFHSGCALKGASVTGNQLFPLDNWINLLFSYTCKLKCCTPWHLWLGPFRDTCIFLGLQPCHSVLFQSRNIYTRFSLLKLVVTILSHISKIIFQSLNIFFMS